MQRRPDQSRRTCPRTRAATTATQFKNAVFDNDTTRNTSLGTVDLFQLGSFDCRYYDSDGTLAGRLAWTSGQPGTLIDLRDRLHRREPDRARPRSTPCTRAAGNLYVNGTVAFSGQAKICATPISGSPCLGNYAPNTNLLELVAVNAGNASKRLHAHWPADFEGVAFMNGNFKEAGNGSIHGAVIADTASVAGNGDVPHQFDPPPGAPGAAATTTTTTSVPDTAALGPRARLLAAAQIARGALHLILDRARRRAAGDDGFGLSSC